jgi:hypothetical protein
MKKIEELEKELEVARTEYNEVFEGLPEELNYKEFQEHLNPISNKIDEISRKLRLIREPQYSVLPSYGNVMALKNFVKNVKSGGFIDYDGSGNYVKGDKMSDITIYPSDVKNKSIRKDFDTIIWFNR